MPRPACFLDPRIKNSEEVKNNISGTSEEAAGEAPDKGPSWAGTTGLERSDSQSLYTIKTQGLCVEIPPSRGDNLKVTPQSWTKDSPMVINMGK